MKNLFNSSISEIEITYRNTVPRNQMRTVASSRDAVDAFRDIWSNQMEHVEQFYILMINRANKVLGYTLIATGGVSATVVDPKIIFQAALKANASQIICAHNHPSGNNKPSEADVRITDKIKAAGQFLDINLLDHVIMTPDDNFYSFADEGRI